MNRLKYVDAIHGTVEITDPVALAILATPAFQRLQGVDQAGYFEPYFPGSRHTRYEHSIGDYLLLRRFGASREEQIAGLLHDLSHSAFSHGIDYVLEEGSETEHSHQDSVFTDFVGKTDIPAILQSHGLDAAYVLDEHNFPLQEKDLPDLCADRIDYCLRTLVAHQVGTRKDAEKILSRLKVRENEWVFDDHPSSERFARLFQELNAKFWSGLESAVMFRRIGDYLRHALERSYIGKEDLWSTDREVLAKVNRHLGDDPVLERYWRNLNDSGGYTNDPENYDAIVYCKSRVVDPLCVHGGAIRRLSELTPAWKNTVKTESRPKTYFLRWTTGNS